MNEDTDFPLEFASPPCFAHELARVPDPLNADDIACWRKAERMRLLAARLAVPVVVRRRAAELVTEQLDQLIVIEPQTIVSLYWPFQAELDLRGWMRRLCKNGARVVLPVVEVKNQALVFREWTTDARLEPGIWNIPVPADGAVLVPTEVIAPLVGFDTGCFRLGYGGGYFDRTLASMSNRGLQPRIIGVGLSHAAIASIYPQAHDIPMDIIVTDNAKFLRADHKTVKY